MKTFNFSCEYSIERTGLTKKKTCCYECGSMVRELNFADGDFKVNVKI